MKKHLIVLDLDGTLLTDQKVISNKTEAALKRAMEAGHRVMIATGRPYRASVPYYRQLGLNTPIVNFNGAFIHNPQDSSWGRFHTPIDLSVVHEVVESMHSYDFNNIVAEVLDDVYIHHHDEKLLDIFTFGEPEVTSGDLRNYLKADPTSLLIHAPAEKVPLIHDHLSSVHAEVIDHRRWGAPWHVIEIVKSGLNKAVGIDRVSKSLGIDRQHIIAFGDEDNDLEMIDYAGVGVAMGNAISPLKSIANEVTLTNNEDGIAEILIDRLKLSI